MWGTKIELRTKIEPAAEAKNESRNNNSGDKYHRSEGFASLYCNTVAWQAIRGQRVAIMR
jgi:hypothetical protein